MPQINSLEDALVIYVRFSEKMADDEDLSDKERSAYSRASTLLLKQYDKILKSGKGSSAEIEDEPTKSGGE
jgi:hypothetical protein